MGLERPIARYVFDTWLCISLRQKTYWDGLERRHSNLGQSGVLSAVRDAARADSAPRCHGNAPRRYPATVYPRLASFLSRSRIKTKSRAVKFLQRLIFTSKGFGVKMRRQCYGWVLFYKESNLSGTEGQYWRRAASIFDVVFLGISFQSDIYLPNFKIC